MATVVMDKGHGLPDPGACDIIQEYIYAGKIADLVRKELERHSVKVVYTRTSDNALNPDKSRDLAARAAISDGSHADLFVSIHLNAGGGTGYETLCYKESDKARTMHKAVMSFLSQHGVRDRGIKERPDVYVIRSPKATSLLLECLFVDSVSDTNLLKDEQFLAGMCRAIAVGILNILGISYVVAPAPHPHPTTPAPDSVATPDWATEARNFVIKAGISDGSRPKDPATREEIWSMLKRLMEVKK